MPAQPITEDEPARGGPGPRRGGKVAGVRLLASGEITRAVTITVSGASAAAVAAVEQAGGSVTHDGRPKAPEPARPPKPERDPPPGLRRAAAGGAE